jgi:hypothetical protein
VIQFLRTERGNSKQLTRPNFQQNQKILPNQEGLPGKTVKIGPKQTGERPEKGQN